MAQTGFTPILLYASGTPGNSPTAGNLTSSASGAELALNYADGKLFYKDSGGSVQTLATKATGSIGGSTTQVQYNNAGALAGSANLTFDGTTLTANALTVSSTTTFGGSVTPATNTVDSVGYTGVPQNSQSAAYTLVAADAGKSIVHPASDNNARTFTIPANGTVAFPVGTTITFINMINTVTIAITTDTMYLAGAGTTGSRTLAAYGMATAVKMTSTTWIISGNGLT